MVESSIEIPENFVQSVLDKEGLSNVEPAESAEQEKDNQQYEVIRSTVSNTLKFMFESFDSESKKKGLPGLGSVPGRELSELSVIVMEKRLPRHLIENSPEAALVAVLGGIAANNFIQYKKQAANLKTEKEEGAHNEN